MSKESNIVRISYSEYISLVTKNYKIWFTKFEAELSELSDDIAKEHKALEAKKAKLIYKIRKPCDYKYMQVLAEKNWMKKNEEKVKEFIDNVTKNPTQVIDILLPENEYHNLLKGIRFDRNLRRAFFWL